MPASQIIERGFFAREQTGVLIEQGKPRVLKTEVKPTIIYRKGGVVDQSLLPVRPADGSANPSENLD